MTPKPLVQIEKNTFSNFGLKNVKINMVLGIFIFVIVSKKVSAFAFFEFERGLWPLIDRELKVITESNFSDHSGNIRAQSEAFTFKKIAFRA